MSKNFVLAIVFSFIVNGLIAQLSQTICSIDNSLYNSVVEEIEKNQAHKFQVHDFPNVHICIGVALVSQAITFGEPGFYTAREKSLHPSPMILFFFIDESNYYFPASYDYDSFVNFFLTHLQNMSDEVQNRQCEILNDLNHLWCSGEFELNLKQ